jgi:hypothetical protein
MRVPTAFAAVLLAAAGPAPGPSCLDKINDALDLSNALPAEGRRAAMTEIDRARDALHEGDPIGCNEKIDRTLRMLRATAAPAGGPGEPEPTGRG